MELVQSGELSMIFDYLKYHRLVHNAIRLLFNLRRKDLVKFLLLKRPELSSQKYCKKDLEMSVLDERNVILLDIFDDLLRQSFNKASFHDSSEEMWNDEIQNVELLFLDYVVFGREELFKEYIKLYELEGHARRWIINGPKYKKLLNIYKEIRPLKLQERFLERHW